MERFVIIVNGSQQLTIITKRFMFDVAAVVDPPLNHFAQIRLMLAVKFGDNA